MMTTIYIMWLRQLKRYWRSKSRIIGSVGQPLLFLIAMGFGMGPVFERAGGGNYIIFLAPGVMAQAIIFMAVFNGVEIIWDRQFGFLKETLVAPISRFEIVLGRVLGGATIATIQGLIVFGLTMLVGFRPYDWLMLPASILMMFLTALFFTGLGTAIASAMEDFHGFQLIMNLLVMPAFFLSGALFPIDSAPMVLKTLARVNPLTYGVDGLRETMTGIVGMGVGLDLVILTSLSLLSLLVGSFLFSKIEA